MKNILYKYNIDSFGFVKYREDLAPFQTRNRTRLPENAQSILCCLFPYNSDRISSIYNIANYSINTSTNNDISRENLYNQILNQEFNISMYSAVNDYHIVAGNILKRIAQDLSNKFPEYKFEPFVDSSPLHEVKIAVEADLGVRGINSLFISEVYGSAVFIGCIVTDLKVELSEFQEDIKDRTCIRCGNCVKFCPGNAINSQGGICAERCLSYFSQSKHELTEQEKNIMRKTGYIWGCDICQLVCPMNRNRKYTNIQGFLDDIIFNVNHENYEALIKTRAFGFRGKKVIKRNLDIINNM